MLSGIRKSHQKSCSSCFEPAAVLQTPGPSEAYFCEMHSGFSSPGSTGCRSRPARGLPGLGCGPLHPRAGQPSAFPESQSSLHSDHAILCPDTQQLAAIAVHGEIILRNLQAHAIQFSQVVSLQPLIFKNGAALLILTPIAASGPFAATGCLFR